jgi:hypothetical protein
MRIVYAILIDLSPILFSLHGHFLRNFVIALHGYAANNLLSLIFNEIFAMTNASVCSNMQNSTEIDGRINSCDYESSTRFK